MPRDEHIPELCALELCVKVAAGVLLAAFCDKAALFFWTCQNNLIESLIVRDQYCFVNYSLLDLFFEHAFCSMFSLTNPTNWEMSLKTCNDQILAIHCFPSQN